MTARAFARILAASATLGIASIASTSTASAATIDVPQDFNTIQEAVDNADPGDTVSINKPKRFAENVAVSTEDLTIRGTKGVVIDGGEAANGPTVQITADGVTVTKLHVQHGDDGIVCTGNRCAVRDVSVAGGDTVECVVITGNAARVTDSSLNPCGGDNALQITGDDFIVDGNKMSRTDSSCIDVDGGGGEITDNRVHNCEDQDGIEGSDLDDTLIARNRISATDEHGIEADGANLRVQDNYVTNVEASCIQSDGDGGQFRSNVIEGCYDHGLETNGDNLKVIGNSVLAGATDDDCYDINGGVRPVVKNNRADICDGGFEVSGENPQVVQNRGTRLGDDDGFDIDCFDDTGGAPVAEACSAGLVRDNSASGNNNDDEGFDISVGNLTGTGFQIVGNRSKNNNNGGFLLSTYGAVIENNVSQNDGAEGNEQAFDIGGEGENEVVGNLALNSAQQGFEIGSNANTLRNNLAADNHADGYKITGTDNVLTRNEAIGNHGDGFDNTGTDLIARRNTARGNDYVDCANSGGTVAVNENNDCADGSDFGEPGGLDP
jgi:parallel beta-helix repeat protein